MSDNRLQEALENIYGSGYSCADYARITAGEALGKPTGKVGNGRQCDETTRANARCSRSARPHSDYCYQHRTALATTEE